MDVWPSVVVDRFNIVPPNPRDNDFYAPYNKLLYTVFPADTKFTVAPQSYPVPESRDSLDFVIKFEVSYDNRPVLVLQIKTPSKLQFVSAREEADIQMRKRLRDLRPLCPLPVLHGISAFGTSLCFYRAQANQHLYPRRISPDPEFETDTAPRDRWSCDLLEQAGANRFQEIVGEIKDQCMIF